jgi:hypothetical protein
VARTREVETDARTTAQLAQREDYQKVRIPRLDGGMVTDKAAVDLNDNESPSIINMALIAGQLQPDTGYVPFGSTITGVYLGSPQTMFQVYNPNGTSSELLVTTATVYLLDQALNQWQIAPWGEYLSNTQLVASGGETVVLSSTTGVEVGGVLGLPLDDGSQLPVTVTGINGDSVAFTPAIPAGRTVPDTSNICLGATLHGNLLQQVIVVTMSAKAWTIVTNNIDPIFYFDGTYFWSLVGEGQSDLPTGTTCQYMLVFHESLFLFNTVEAGVALPQRIRMSDLGNPTSWTPGGDSGASIAAIYDQLDTEDFIQAATIVGPYLIVYRDTTIMRGTYLGLLDETMFWEYTVYGEGLSSAGGVAEIGAEQQFVGQGNIYQYSGGYDLQGVGDNIYVNFLSAIGDLNASYKAMLFEQYVPDYDEVWVFYPAGKTATYPNKMLRNSLEKNSWAIRLFANSFVSANPFLPVSTTTWESASGTWAEQVAQWDSRIFLANVASIVLCDAEAGGVYVYDYSAQTDNGTAIAWSFQTKDIGPGNEMQRFDSVRVYGKGNAVLCEFSIDGGQTWETAGTFNFGTGYSLQILTMGGDDNPVVAPYIRFQLSGTDPEFVFNWLESWFLKESEW